MLFFGRTEAVALSANGTVSARLRSAGRKGHHWFSCIRGRPGPRSVKSSPRRRAVAATHGWPPRRRPRSTHTRKLSNRASPSLALTRAVQVRGHSTGQESHGTPWKPALPPCRARQSPGNCPGSLSRLAGMSIQRAGSAEKGRRCERCEREKGRRRKGGRDAEHNTPSPAPLPEVEENPSPSPYPLPEERGAMCSMQPGQCGGAAVAPRGNDCT
jgi:hypothetical protein